MYSPAYARVTDRRLIDPIIRQNPFATICFCDPLEHSPQSFHLPLILKDKSLIGHLALANEACKKIDGREILIIFHGPHCYISPEWYGSENNVPTWNYVSIHVRGRAIIKREMDFLKLTLRELAHQEDPDLKIEANIDSHQRLLDSIVGIEIKIQEIEAKFKLAQSKPKEEREHLIQVLKKTNIPEHHRVAVLMEGTLQ